VHLVALTRRRFKRSKPPHHLETRLPRSLSPFECRFKAAVNSVFRHPHSATRPLIFFFSRYYLLDGAGFREAELKSTSRQVVCRSHEAVRPSPLDSDTRALRLLAAVRPAAGMSSPPTLPPYTELVAGQDDFVIFCQSRLQPISNQQPAVTPFSLQTATFMLSASPAQIRSQRIQCIGSLSAACSYRFRRSLDAV